MPAPSARRCCSFNRMVGELRDLLLSQLCRYDTEEQIDAELFGAKLRRLERAALQEPNGDLRKELLALHGRAEPLKYERDHLAHGALWADADGTILRRFM